MECSQEDLDKLVSEFKLLLIEVEGTKNAILSSEDTITMEMVVAPDSKMINKSIKQVRFKRNLHVNLLAISRQGKKRQDRVKNFLFKSGDVILIHGQRNDVEDAVPKLGCYPLAERNIEFGKRELMMPALIIFASGIFLAAFNILPLQVSLAISIMLMLLFNIIPIRELYDGLDLPVIVMLGSMIPVGMALEDTGTTKLIANFLFGMCQDNSHLISFSSPIVALFLILIVTMVLSDLLNSITTAILMAPIARQVAQSFEANLDPFLMVVAVGSACAFLTPIGHQNNALVMGPGGYKFKDYWKMGLPLEIIIAIVSIPLILRFWPLY